MTSAEIQNSINNVRNALDEKENELKELLEKLELLIEVIRKSKESEEKFCSSISNRNKKLLSIGDLVDRMNVAKRYMNKMQDTLNGSEYKTALENINQLNATLSSEKKSLEERIETLKREIRDAKQTLSNLNVQYQNSLEEEQNNE